MRIPLRTISGLARRLLGWTCVLAWLSVPCSMRIAWTPVPQGSRSLGAAKEEPVGLSANGEVFATYASWCPDLELRHWEQRLRLWDTSTGRMRGEINGPLAPVGARSGDGK